MTSVFSSMVWPSRPRRPSPRANARTFSGSSQQPIALTSADEPDLRELNAGLQALVDIFPDIQPEVFREMLSSFSDESRLEVITEALLKQGAKWVRGRYRTPAEHPEEHSSLTTYKYRSSEQRKDTRGMPLAVEDTFRSQSYKDAAKEELYREFSGLSRSKVKGVLAEYNWSYSQTRPALLLMASKSWKFTISNFFVRRKPPTAKDHPLVIWQSADPTVPLLIQTKSRELDKELYDTLIAPELEKQRAEQVANDKRLALQWNETEAEEAGEMYDCECCYIPNTLEQMSTCNADCHYICFSCIRHSINSALYDQGWARNIDSKLCTLRCIAPTAGGLDQCPGCVPFYFVERALLEEKDGEDALHKLQERMASVTLMRSKLRLVRCPFCAYAEVDSLSLSKADLLSSLRLRRGRLLLASVPILELMCYRIFRLFVQALIALGTFIALLSWFLARPSWLMTSLESALRRIHLKKRGLRFQCLSPSCGRASCLSCSAPWYDPHTCYSSQAQSLRLTLERATTDAVKRTCPDCNLGFVKSDGCNKLVCLCGYSMCYICRQGLANEGYHHFCQHFRDQPGSQCTECNKCDLYRVEDEDVVVQRAREIAEREWWEKQGSHARDGLEKCVKRELKGWDTKGRGRLRSQGSWETWLERILEALIV